MRGVVEDFPRLLIIFWPNFLTFGQFYPKKSLRLERKRPDRIFDQILTKNSQDALLDSERLLLKMRGVVKAAKVPRGSLDRAAQSPALTTPHILSKSRSESSRASRASILDLYSNPPILVKTDPNLKDASHFASARKSRRCTEWPHFESFLTKIPFQALSQPPRRSTFCPKSRQKKPLTPSSLVAELVLN